MELTDWKKIINEVLKRRPHQNIIVSKHHLAKHPSECGFVKTLGIPRGQINDYELTLKDGRRVHVVEFKDYYKVHWDILSPRVSPLGHLICDAPYLLILPPLFFTGVLVGCIDWISRNII